MREKRIESGPQLFALSRHDVNGVVQQHAADFGRRLGHEDARLRLATHQDRQCADVVLMGVRNNDRVEPAIAERFPIRQRLFAFKLRVHSGVEHKAVAARL